VSADQWSEVGGQRLVTDSWRPAVGDRRSAVGSRRFLNGRQPYPGAAL